MDQDVGAIKALSEKWARASLDADWERWAELITDDFKWLPPNEPAIEGKATPQGDIAPTERKIEVKWAFFLNITPEGLLAEDRSYLDSAVC